MGHKVFFFGCMMQKLVAGRYIKQCRQTFVFVAFQSLFLHKIKSVTFIFAKSWYIYFVGVSMLRCQRGKFGQVIFQLSEKSFVRHSSSLLYSLYYIQLFTKGQLTYVIHTYAAVYEDTWLHLNSFLSSEVVLLLDRKTWSERRHVWKWRGYCLYLTRKSWTQS